MEMEILCLGADKLLYFRGRMGLFRRGHGEWDLERRNNLSEVIEYESLNVLLWIERNVYKSCAMI
jgi:hypothetical protein